MRVVEPDILIELTRQLGAKIVAGQFGLRAIDHADRALQPLLAERIRAGQIVAAAKSQQEMRMSGVMAEPFIATGQRGPQSLYLHRAAPVGSRSDGPAVSAKADQIGLRAVGTAAEM